MFRERETQQREATMYGSSTEQLEMERYLSPYRDMHSSAWSVFDHPLFRYFHQVSEYADSKGFEQGT